MPTDEPSRAGLTKHGIAERVARLVAGAQRDVPRHRDAVVAHDRLEQVLVHAERRGEHARADVRDARELEQALHGPVLAERAVQDREDDVDVRRAPRPPSRAGGSRRALRRLGLGRAQLASALAARSAQAPSRPISTVTTSSARARERLGDARGRRDARSRARSSGRPRATAIRRLGASRSAGSSVVGVVVRRRRRPVVVGGGRRRHVSAGGGDELPTMIVTVEPFSASRPPGPARGRGRPGSGR